MVPDVLTHRPRPVCSFHQQPRHGTRLSFSPHHQRESSLDGHKHGHGHWGVNMSIPGLTPTACWGAKGPTPLCGCASRLSQSLSSGPEFCAHRQFRDGHTSENLFISWQVPLNTPSQADTPSVGSPGQWVRQKHLWICPTLVAPATCTPSPGGQTVAEVSLVTHGPPQLWQGGGTGVLSSDLCT